MRSGRQQPIRILSNWGFATPLLRARIRQSKRRPYMDTPTRIQSASIVYLDLLQFQHTYLLMKNCGRRRNIFKKNIWVHIRWIQWQDKYLIVHHYERQKLNFKKYAKRKWWYKKIKAQGRLIDFQKLDFVWNLPRNLPSSFFFFTKFV